MSFIVGLVYQAIRMLLTAGSSFEWSRGGTPLSAPLWPAAGVMVYLSLVYVLQRALKQPVALPKLVAPLHNFALCVGSAIMFAGCASALVEEAQRRGSVDFFFCMPQRSQPRGRLFFWSYVYYLSKYYEFADTLLLLLRKRSATLLGVFHHALVVPMAWLWVDQAQTLQWGGLLTNTAVHVVMYAYFFLTTLGSRPRWKKYITAFQIVQFASSFLTLIPFAIYQLRWRADAGGCAGLGALAYNAAFNACLLLLFARFYAREYKARKGAKRKAG